MERLSGQQSDCRYLGMTCIAPGSSNQPQVPQWSNLEFPPLSCKDLKEYLPNGPLNLHGKSHRKSRSLQDGNNNMFSSGITEMKNRYKFRPADNLWCFSFGTETADLQTEQLFVDKVSMEVSRDLEGLCSEYLPQWNDRHWQRLNKRKTRGKLACSFEGYIRGRLGELPPDETKRLVNFRVLSRKNKRHLTITDNIDKRKKNSNRKLESKGLKRGIGNMRYLIDVDVLNNAMPRTATQQRALRNSRDNIKENSKCFNTTIRPTSRIKERRKARWESKGQFNQIEKTNKFELHHENIACLEDIKNEDDLWHLMNIQHRELTPEDYDLLLQLDESIAPKTVSEETLSNLRVETVDGSKLAGSLFGQLCSICIEDYSVGQKVKHLPCDHCYHEKCIDNWLTYCDSKCPLDGSEIS